MILTKNIREDLLYYIWQCRIYSPQGLTSTEGEELTILDPGQRNQHAGPDFFNARLKIGTTIWAGNVEMHVRASDWKRHGHHTDQAYDNVILHVVYEADTQVTTTKGNPIPVLELKNYIPLRLLQKYQQLQVTQTWIPCAASIQKVDSFHQQQTFEKTLVERLEQKSQPILETLETLNNNWNETFYLHFSKQFGANTNSLPFELLVKSIPLKLILKYRRKEHDLAALLFGQAGFLIPNMQDAYPNLLYKTYQHLQYKHQLQPLSKSIWKFGQHRPPNFPTMRIAQLVAFWQTHEQPFLKLRKVGSLGNLVRFLEVVPHSYWETHYVFDTPSKQKRSKKVGKEFVYHLLINAVIPILFLYGKRKDLPDLQERILDFLELLPPEKNRIVKKWKELGIKAKSAIETQGMIQLKTRYCDAKRCLECGIGHQILKE